MSRAPMKPGKPVKRTTWDAAGVERAFFVAISCLSGPTV